LNIKIIVRREIKVDIPAIHQLNEKAFGGSDEAEIIASLRKRNKISLSLVAVEDDHIVGHILFSPVVIQSDNSSFPAIALGPMAVLPSRQRLGIGSQLVQAGLAECKKIEQLIVVVLGHPEFYTRFGFKPSLTFGIRWEKDIPAEVFMVNELKEGALTGCGEI
jgi:putative acetyltransferase